MAKPPKSLKKKLANPGERSKLPAKYLSPVQRQQRETNARLAQPIAQIPGTQLASPLTERDLAHEAGAATSVKYAPSEQAIAEQLTQAVQQKNDAQAWYDDYKTRLQGYQQQVAGYQQGALDAMKAFQGGVTGLGQQDQSYVQGQQAQMPQGTAPVGASVGQDANAALAVRQGIAGNFGVNQANVGAANNTYASNLANVVGPQQQLTALSNKQAGVNKVLKQKTALKSEEGAYNQEYRSNRRNDETKNLLAAGALNVNLTNAATSAANTAADNQRQTTKDRQSAMDSDRQYKLDAAKFGADQAKDRYQRAHHLGPYKPSKTTGPTNGSKGPKLTTQQQNTGIAQIPNLKEYLARAKGGKAFVEGHPKQAPLGRAGAVQKVRNSTKKLVSDALLGAAADAVYDKHISPTTAKRLKEAGFDPARIARELGVPLRSGSSIPLNKK